MNISLKKLGIFGKTFKVIKVWHCAFSVCFLNVKGHKDQSAHNLLVLNKLTETSY